MPNKHCYLLTSLILAFYCAALPAAIEPRSRDVELHEFTEMVIPVIPDLSTRLIFPFDFSTLPDDKRLSMELINNSIFNIDGGSHDGNAISVHPGKNTLVISINKPSDSDGRQNLLNDIHLGMLSLTVNGYHITLMLKTTLNAGNYYSDIVFRENKDKRLYLFKNALADLRKEQDRLFNKKMENLDAVAEKKSLARLGKAVIQEPGVINLRFEQEVSLKNGGNVIVYIEKILDYNF